MSDLFDHAVNLARLNLAGVQTDPLVPDPISRRVQTILLNAAEKAYGPVVYLDDHRDERNPK